MTAELVLLFMELRDKIHAEGNEWVRGDARELVDWSLSCCSRVAKSLNNVEIVSDAVVTVARDVLIELTVVLER